MVIKVFVSAALSLYMVIAVFATSTTVFAGNRSSAPVSSPVDNKSLSEIMIQQSALMKETRGSLEEVLDEIPQIVSSPFLKSIKKHQYKIHGITAGFLSDEQNSTPNGIIYDNPGLNRFTQSDVKELLGQPDVCKSKNGMVELSYTPNDASEYLRYYTTFKFKEDTLIKIAFIVL